MSEIRRETIHCMTRPLGNAIGGFIASQNPCRPSFANRIRIIAAYPLYLVEGFLWRLRHG